jgi:hypothetical protein
MEVQGFPDYLIYNDGRVWSKKSNIFMKLQNDKDGYKGVALCDKRLKIRNKRHKVHRLVAIHYIPNPENKKEVDHINRIVYDNRVENLRWVTAKENANNRGMMKTNTSGHRYIHYDKTKKTEYKWRFHYSNPSKNKYFKTKTDALCYKYIYLLKIKVIK